MKRQAGRLGCGARRAAPIATTSGLISGEHYTMSETCTYLDVSRNALLGLVRRGAVSPNQVTDFAPWRVSRQELDSDQVQRLVRVLKQTGRLPKGGCPENQSTLFDDEC